MDIKEQISKVVDTVSKNPALLEQFKSDPVKAVESILSVDLPDDVINQIITAVKGKITADQAKGAFDTIKKLF